MIGVLSVGVLAGVVVGVALSLLWLVYVATRPGIPLLGREPGTHVFRDLVENPDDETFPGVAVLRLDSGLFFATAEALEERVRGLVEGGDELEALVLDLEGVNFIDSQGAGKLQRSTSLRIQTLLSCVWLGSSQTFSRCYARTGSSTRSAPTTFTATSSEPSAPNGPTSSRATRCTCGTPQRSSACCGDRRSTRACR